MDHGMDAQSLSNVFAPSPVVAGGLLVHNGTQYVNVALGTVGQYLRSNGTTAVWSAPVIGDIALTSGQILVGNGSNVAAAVAMSGNVTISNSGVTTIGAAQVTNSMLVNNSITIGGTTIALGGSSNTFSNTIVFTNTSPFSVANGQTLTVSVTVQTVGAATLTVPNFAGVSDTFQFITLAQTIKNKTFDTSNVLADATDTTKQIGFSISGNTTGIKLTVASTQSTAQTLTLPNITGADTVAVLSLAQTLSNKTLASLVLSGTITGTYNIGGTPTLTVTLNANAQTISGGFTSTGTITMSSANIALGSNNLNLTDFVINESTTNPIIGNAVTFQSTGTYTSLLVLPKAVNGSSYIAGIAISRSTTLTGNLQMLGIFSDFDAVGGYDIDSLTAGTASALPINIRMQASNGGAKTKLMSFDVANTITSYVDFLQTTGKKIGFNVGLTTYIYESSASVLDTAISSITRMRLQGSSTYDTVNIPVASNATASLGSLSQLGNGLIIITSDNGFTVLCAGTGGRATIPILAQSDSGHFTNTKDNANTENIYYDSGSGHFLIQNKTASSRTYVVTQIIYV